MMLCPSEAARMPGRMPTEDRVCSSPNPTTTAGMFFDTIIKDCTAERPKRGAVNAGGENQNEFAEILSPSEISISEPP